MNGLGVDPATAYSPVLQHIGGLDGVSQARRDSAGCQIGKIGTFEAELTSLAARGARRFSIPASRTAAALSRQLRQVARSPTPLPARRSAQALPPPPILGIASPSTIISPIWRCSATQKCRLAGAEFGRMGDGTRPMTVPPTISRLHCGITVRMYK